MLSVATHLYFYVCTKCNYLKIFTKYVFYQCPCELNICHLKGVPSQQQFCNPEVAHSNGGFTRGGTGARPPCAPPVGVTKKIFKHNFIAIESDNIFSSKILHLKQPNTPAYKHFS